MLCSLDFTTLQYKNSWVYLGFSLVCDLIFYYLEAALLYHTSAFKHNICFTFFFLFFFLKSVKNTLSIWNVERHYSLLALPGRGTQGCSRWLEGALQAEPHCQTSRPCWRWWPEDLLPGRAGGPALGSGESQHRKRPEEDAKSPTQIRRTHENTEIAKICVYIVDKSWRQYSPTLTSCFWLPSISWFSSTLRLSAATIITRCSIWTHIQKWLWTFWTISTKNTVSVFKLIVSTGIYVTHIL